MTSDFEETTDNHGPAFAAFAYNLLEDILAQADNPAQMNRELVEQLRELTGARLVVLARRPAWEKGHELAAVEPERRRPLAESPIMMALANRTRHLAGPTLWEKENAPPEAKTLLAENLPGPAVAAPLRVGGKRVGALLLFGLPHEHSLDQVVDALDMLARVVALVLRNAALYEDQEAAIAARTRQLAEAHERLDVTLRSIGDAVIATDIQGNVTLINLVAEHLTGWKEAEAQGRPLAEIFPIINEQTRREVENPVTQVLNKGVVVGLANHTLLIARDGAERPIADSGAPIRDAQGDISGVVLVFRDQTKERAAQKALQESEEKFRRAVLNAPFPIMLHAENGEVLQINAEWESLTGYAIDEISTIGDWTEKAYGERKRLVQADIDRLYDLDTKVDAGRYEIITRSGQKRTWEFSSAPLGRLPDQRRLVISMAMDVTERVRAEQALRDSEEKYRSIFEGANDGIIHVDKSLKVLNANPAFTEITDIAKEAVIGKSGFMLAKKFVNIKQLPQILNIMKDIRSNKSVNAYELNYQDKILEISASRQENGQSVGLIRDITERVQAEQALRQLNQAMEQSPVSVMITDTEGVIQYVNPKFSQVTGYSAA
ncbi:MAG: PAS domain S-box protein, partial [Anaerolineae bacterium]